MQIKANQRKRKLESRASLTLVADTAESLAVKPLFISDKNSEAVTGVDFRRWKQHFPHLVRRVGRKDVISSEALDRAVQDGFRRAFESPEAEAQLDAAEKVRELLRECESVRRGGRR